MHWEFDPIGRIEHAVERTVIATVYLRRSIADEPKGSTGRARLAPRLEIMEARLARLRAVARAWRHNARHAATLAD
jgi:hypothetical protein